MPTVAITGQTTFGANTSGTTTQLDNNFLLAYNALNNFNQYTNYLVDSGAANAYVVTAPASTTVTLAAGLPIQFKATNANTGASTINVNGTGVKNILNPNGTALFAGQIAANAIVSVIYDGTQYLIVGGAANSPLIIDSANAPGSISNSNAATDVYTKSIPANSLGTLRSLSVEIDGVFQNNTGGSVTVQFQLKYGGTVLADSGAVSWTTSGNSRPWKLVATIAAAALTNAQKTNAQLSVAAAVSEAGAMSTLTADFVTSCANSLAIDSTAAQNLILTCTLGTASVSATLNVRHAHVVLN